MAAGRGRRDVEGHACEEHFTPPLTPGSKAGGVIERGYGVPPVLNCSISFFLVELIVYNKSLYLAVSMLPTMPGGAFGQPPLHVRECLRCRFRQRHGVTSSPMAAGSRFEH